MVSERNITSVANDGIPHQRRIGGGRSNFSHEGTALHFGGLAPAQYRRTLDLMNEAVDSELSLKALANNVGLSVYHFARAFKKTSGVSTYRYVTQLRISAACDLIKTTDHTITDIAHLIGYSDAGTFSRAFRNELGLTPREYRHRFGKR
jgi:AraC family transcriptional regulator